MKSYTVFDMTKPLLSDDAEVKVLAKNPNDAIRKATGITNGVVRQVKIGGRFVLSCGKQKRVYDIFNN